MRTLKRSAGGVLAVLISTALMVSAPPAAAAQGEDEGEDMLYLVEFEATEAGAPTSREQAIELLEGLIIPSLSGLAEEDRILGGGLLVGARAGAFVIRAESHDEVTHIVRALPAWGVWAWKVTPLESFAHRTELETDMVEKLREE